jgi:hypothetical protein
LRPALAAARPKESGASQQAPHGGGAARWKAGTHGARNLKAHARRFNLKKAFGMAAKEHKEHMENTMNYSLRSSPPAVRDYF